MPGANSLIQVPQGPKHTPQAAVHFCNLHLHMHQHTHQHAFTPTFYRSMNILPAPMGSQDSEFNRPPPRETTRPSFVPVTAFHRATQKSFRSTQKRGRWGALHVCIAWKIYYNEQLKKMQQKPNSLHRELTPSNPATGPPDSVQHKESDRPCCTHPDLDSSCGRSGNTAENGCHLNRSHPSDPQTSSPHCSRATKREKLDWGPLEQPPTPRWDERLNEKEPTDTTKGSPVRGRSWDRTVIPELDGRHGGSLERKRQLECDSSIRVKRVKQGIVDDQYDSSGTLRADPSHTCPSSYTLPVLHVADLSVSCPDSSRFHVTRAPGRVAFYPGAEMHPYQTASWEPAWEVHRRLDPHSRQNAPRNSSANSCKVIQIPFVAQRQREAFHGFFAPPFYFPHASGQQETVYLRGRGFPHSRHENGRLHPYRHQLPHPGFLPTAYLGP